MVSFTAATSWLSVNAFEKSLPENQQFAFLPKPFTLSQLVAAVKETMTPS